MSDTVLHLAGILLPLLCAVFGVIAMAALINRNYTKFTVFMIHAAVCIGAIVVLLPLTPKAVKPASSSAVPTPDPTRSNPGVAEVAASPPAIPAHTSFDPSGLFAVLIVLAILVMLGAVIAGMIFVIPRLKKAAHAKSENISAWKDVIKRHNEVRAQWTAYEMDMSKLIDMPVMTDMREPVIIALHKALKTASSLAPKSLDNLAYTSIKDSAFLAAVNDLEVAFNSAEQTAKKIAWSKFSKEERRSLSTAKQLLSLAMDSGASPAERQAAYKRVFKELQGLIEFPEKARIEIESRHQLSLAA